MQESSPDQLSVTRESFTYYVKGALAGLYDQVCLQTSPLAGMLCPEQTLDGTRATSLRRLLREGIESLRPDACVPFGRREWLGYRLLWRRYVHHHSRHAICEELVLGRSSYYRHHQQALDALASVLWDRYRQRGTDARAQDAPSLPLSPNTQATEEAVRLALESPRQLVNVKELPEGVAKTLLLLAEQEGVSLFVCAPEALPPAYVDPGLVRAALLGVLSSAIELAAGGSVRLEVSLAGSETIWRLRGLDQLRPTVNSPEDISGFAMARDLLNVYGGRLWVEPTPDGPSIVLTLPVGKPRTILVIDDDSDTIRFYRRSLQAHHYAVRAARSSAQLEAQLAEATPDLIVLDVLMPQWDGWSVLQRLKTVPETRRIPVVVCSVLSQPALALSLGAAEVLRKPVSGEKLLQTIGQIADRGDSEE